MVRQPGQPEFAPPHLCGVTADLVSPAVFDSWWPAPLDGLVAAAARLDSDAPRDRLPAGRLPLARWKRGLNNQWVWLASSVILESPVPRDAPLRSVTPGPLRWIAAGDPERLVQALSRLDQVGAQRLAGQGRVSSWRVEDLGACDPGDLTAVIWRADGYLSRPVPVRGAAVLGLQPGAVQTVGAAIRPPYSAAPRQPSGARAWRQVLAPWTFRPRD